ncbi:MAG TPA: ubiquitin-activating E1 FCCH domain-containing protein [Devosia sp.]|nr:ubiquitin-activating E1 FCCH domain-containing protein [Devosia sp.]
MQRLTELLARFRKDERGAFMVLFAVLALVLIATSGAVVDFTNTETARSRAQTALDAAALALQTQMSTQTTTQLKTKAQAILTQHLNDTTITATVNSVTVDTVAGKIDLAASLTVPTYFVQLVGVHSISSNLTSEATRGSKDIEVSVALDTTGSMAGEKITELINATNTLIDLVVQTTQTPTYSKMAIIPWTQGVNVGSAYATSIRGPVTGSTPITAATWMSGTNYTVSAITKANPAVITTSAANGFAAGSYIYLSNISGMTQVSNTIYKVGTVQSTTKFTLQTTSGSNVNSSSYSTFSTSGSPRVTKCLNTGCIVTVTSTAHGLANGDNVYITSVGGMTGLNSASGTVHPVGTTTTNTFQVTDETAATLGMTLYTSGGNAYCVKYGCLYYYFTSAAGGHNLYQVNNCPTERSGANAFTDVAPSTTRFNYNYVSGGSDCITQTIQPLTSNKTTLHNLANSLTAANSTAGHLGLAWGWYMISPNFGYLWPTASQPAAYGRANLIKAVVLMTDGEFNIQYCNGVLSSDSINGTSSQKINCSAPDGTSQNQAVALCNGIKAAANDTVLYTVGFDLEGDTNAINLLRTCATSPADFFQATAGTSDLTTDFTAIAQDLNNLRISK